MTKRKQKIMLFLAIAAIGPTAHAGISGNALTVECSVPWGGVSGNCTMTKRVENLVPDEILFNYDKLKWKCSVIRQGGNKVAEKTHVQNVPSIPIGGSWGYTEVVRTNENRPETQYCTFNRSEFYYEEAGRQAPLIGINSVFEQHCIRTAPVSGGFDR